VEQQNGQRFMTDDNKLKKVLEISELVNSSLDIAEIRTKAINAAAELVDAQGASLLFVDDVTGDLYFDSVSGDKSDFLKSVQLKRGEGVAGWVTTYNQPVIVDDVQNDPRFSRRVDKRSGIQTKNMLCVPVRIKNKVIGALQAINKKDGRFSERDQDLLSTFANHVAVAAENARLYSELRGTFHATVQALVDAMDMYDPYNTGHARRVSAYCVAIGKVLGFSNQMISTLKLSAILHDVGMMGVPEKLLLGAQNNHDDRKDVIKRHVDNAVQMLNNIKPLKECMPAIRHHHEYYDGTGYPDGLKGNQIPLQARVVAVADAFDAMLHKRPYVTRLSHMDAITSLKSMAGRQYDPAIVDAFVMAYESYNLGQIG
jgi:HD-GYP domain-containing protein (c-di-GMP phosphodiesterase class II)